MLVLEGYDTKNQKGNRRYDGGSNGSGGVSSQLSSLENEIRGRKFETLIFSNGQGDIIFRNDSEKADVVWGMLASPENIARTKGGTMLHNHPLGNSFSDDDIMISVVFRVANSRIVSVVDGKKITYNLRITYNDKKIADYESLMGERIHEYTFRKAGWAKNILYNKAKIGEVTSRHAILRELTNPKNENLYQLKKWGVGLAYSKC